MSRRRLRVSVSGVHVGHVVRNREGLTRWEPDATWVQAGQSPPLGLDFLRDTSPRTAGTGLPAWFENLLPEVGSALRAQLARIWQLRGSDGLGLLAALGADLPGAVLVEEDDDTAEVDARPPLAEPDPLAPLWRFSLAGMQLKLSMASANDRFFLPATAAGGKWIVKLPGPTMPELPGVEAATMAWARACGLPVPAFKVVAVEQLDGLPEGWAEQIPQAFAVERFDRRPDGTRIHHEDLCQALGLLPDHKYGDTGNPNISLDGVARLIQDACGEEEALALALRVGFVIASGNDDAHLKNWSIAWGRAQRPRLTPCYDQVCTISWPSHGWDRAKGPTLGLGLGRNRHFARLDDDTLRRHAEAARLPGLRDAVHEGLRRARTAWPEIADQAPPPMREALRVHWRRVPLLRSVGAL